MIENDSDYVVMMLSIGVLNNPKSIVEHELGVAGLLFVLANDVIVFRNGHNAQYYIQNRIKTSNILYSGVTIKFAKDIKSKQQYYHDN